MNNAQPLDVGIAPSKPLGSSHSTEVNIKGHVPALDGVRGLAILMVLLVHFIADARPDTRVELVITQLASYGTMGVDVFFVLSGFLITGILYDSRHKRAFFRNFYMRRVLRIFPLYYGILVLALLLVPRLVYIPALQNAVDHQVWLWAYAANIFLAIKGNWEALPMFSHFWSLAVEEHFYFVWPLVVYLCDGKLLKRVAIGVIVLATAIRVVMVEAGVNNLAIHVLTPGRLDALAMGGLMAVIARDAGGMLTLVRAARRLLLASVSFIVGSVVLTRLVPTLGWLHEVRSTAFEACFSALLIFAVGGPLMVRRLFQSQFMVFFGKYSYGLYVLHFLFGYFLIRYRTEDWVARWVHSHTLAIFVQGIAAGAVAVVLAYASYHLFEKHFLKLKARF